VNRPEPLAAGSLGTPRFAARLLAALVDAGVVLCLATLLSRSSGRYFAERAAVTFQIGEPGSAWKGPIPMLLGAVSTLAYGIPFAALLVLVSEALFAASPGKLLGRCEIVTAPGLRARALWSRFAIKGAPAWLFCVALVAGSWPLAVLAALASGVTFFGCLAAPFGRSTLHDHVAGTQVRAHRG
jgi:hypothetical protein